MTTDTDVLKRAAAEHAVQLITSGMVVGLGTGSTMQWLLDALGRRLREGTVCDVVAVPTSEATARRCAALGIPVTTLEEHPEPALAVDGADEIGPRLGAIKGGGGAMLREKVVALAAKRFVLIADESKLVRHLGTRAPVPVEVVPFGWTVLVPFFESLGAAPVLRRGPGGEPFVTDNGNWVVDCRFARGIAEPAAVARALARRTGVVEDGLFLRIARLAVVAGRRGVRLLRQ